MDLYGGRITPVFIVLSNYKHFSLPLDGISANDRVTPAALNLPILTLRWKPDPSPIHPKMSGYFVTVSTLTTVPLTSLTLLRSESVLLNHPHLSLQNSHFKTKCTVIGNVESLYF